MKRSLALLAAVLLLAPAPAQAASSYGTYPNCTTPAIPVSVEAYDGPNETLTTSACFPVLAPVTGNPGLTVTTTTRNITGTLNLVRWSQESTVKQAAHPNISLTNPTTRTDTLPFAQSMVTGGWREIRVTSNLAEPDQRVYTTTRWCVNAGGTGDYCGGPTVRGRCGGGSWYGAYIISWIDCRDVPRASKAGAWTARFTFGGERGVVQVDDRTVYDGSGGQQTVLIPAMPVGQHRLRILSWHTRTSSPTGTFGGAAVFTYQES